MAGPVRPASRGSGPHGAPLVSYESLEMMRKVQVKEIGGDDIVAWTAFVKQLFGIAT
jgi:hypothetical protein